MLPFEKETLDATVSKQCITAICKNSTLKKIYIKQPTYFIYFKFNLHPKDLEFLSIKSKFFDLRPKTPTLL